MKIRLIYWLDILVMSSHDNGRLYDDLKEAIKLNSYDRVVLAVEAGADVNGHPETSYAYKCHHLYWAMRFDISIIRYLILKGANINSLNGHAQWTPLHKVVFEGNFEVVKLLIEYGAQTWHTDIYGRTVINIAEMNGHFEIAEYIRSYNDIPVKGVNV